MEGGSQVVLSGSVGFEVWMMFGRVWDVWSMLLLFFWSKVNDGKRRTVFLHARKLVFCSTVCKE